MQAQATSNQEPEDEDMAPVLCYIVLLCIPFIQMDTDSPRHGLNHKCVHGVRVSKCPADCEACASQQIEPTYDLSLVRVALNSLKDQLGAEFNTVVIAFAR